MDWVWRKEHQRWGNNGDDQKPHKMAGNGEEWHAQDKLEFENHRVPGSIGWGSEILKISIQYTILYSSFIKLQTPRSLLQHYRESANTAIQNRQISRSRYVVRYEDSLGLIGRVSFCVVRYRNLSPSGLNLSITDEAAKSQEYIVNN